MNRHGKTTKTERDLNVSYFVKVKLRVRVFMVPHKQFDSEEI